MMWRSLLRVAVASLASFVGGMLVDSVAAQDGEPICVMNVDGTGMREVARVPPRGVGSPDWSPDGKYIAFDAVGPSGWQDQRVFVVEVATGKITDLGRGGVPSFAPDGEHVALHNFYGNRPGGTMPGIWFASRDGSSAKFLIEDGSHPRFSHDGKLLA
ncbi:MAG: PD40 domain-containing protein [Planctomycetales bacterium]|nr:PD40 domain-containing protein [Planctomycetales bacterium]